MTSIIVRLNDTFVTLTEEVPQHNYPTSYVNLVDLEEVLDQYFSNKLDDVELKCETFYLPVSQWYSNNLLGQCDSQLITAAASKLTTKEQDTLEYCFTFDPNTKVNLIQYWANEPSVDGSFEEWLESTYDNALNKLAEAIRKRL